MTMSSRSEDVSETAKITDILDAGPATVKETVVAKNSSLSVGDNYDIDEDHLTHRHGQHTENVPELIQIPSPPPYVDSAVKNEPISSHRERQDHLNLEWTFGINERVPILNITDYSRRMVMYVCAHTAVLFDVDNNEQQLLQGHSHNITCSCVSHDKRWLATCDKGADSTIIVWDTLTGFPVRTIFQPHPDGIISVAITPDAKYLSTLSSCDPQVLSIWDWTNGADEPLCSTLLRSSYGLQNYILFNPDDLSQIVSNSDHQVIFYSWYETTLKYCAPQLTDQDFNKPVGRYSQTIYQKHTTRALTATSLGNLVVWDSNRVLTVVDTEPTPDKRALKLVKIQDVAIKVLTTTEDYVVIGNAAGVLQLLDQKLKLVNWYQDFDIGPINAVSFAYNPNFVWNKHNNSDSSTYATVPCSEFVVKDFAVGTSSAVLAYISAGGNTVNVIHRDHWACICGIDTHPTEPHCAIGSYAGLLKIWNYELKECVVSRYFEKSQMIRCCAYDPSGELIAVGFMDGSSRILDAITLGDLLREPFRCTHDPIVFCTFSHDSKYLATADVGFAVTLYRHDIVSNSEWEYLGRSRPHYKRIMDILFTVHLESGLPRLLTLGEDRMLVEYDVMRSERDSIVIISTDRIEQSASSLCFTMYPTITKEQFILTANDRYKLKLYNSTTKMCRKTLLGPTFGSPLQRIVILPTDEANPDVRYMAFITVDKIGIIKLPLTGNPHDAIAVTAHPSGVTNMVASYDGRYIFTSGGSDSVVQMWSTDVKVLEAKSKLGGEDLIPFYELLDGGLDGDFFVQLEDYFYFAQIRSQEFENLEPRDISDEIPLQEVPSIMRAIGFYPSEQEVQEMMNEVKFGRYVVTGKYIDAVDLGTIIKLYLNHRPPFGLDPRELKLALYGLSDGKSDDGESQIDRKNFFDILQSKGEGMTDYDICEYMTTLLGFNKQDASCELKDFEPSVAGRVMLDNLPQDITGSYFTENVMDFAREYGSY